MELPSDQQKNSNNIQNTCNVNINSTYIKKKNKRKKKKKPNKSKNNRGIKKVEILKPLKGNNKFVCTMASWAENYSKIVTWQSRHQIAYWKAKATALEHENKILHEIIRKNRLNSIDTSSDSSSDCEDAAEPYNSSYIETNDDDSMEVSPEYIEFLIANSKFREDAKREREKYRNGKSNSEDLIKKMEELPVASEETDHITQAKILYGDNYKHIVALEMACDTKFLADKDKYSPVYWPNTPFNP